MWRGVEFWPFPLTCFVAFKTLSHYRANVWCVCTHLLTHESMIMCSIEHNNSPLVHRMRRVSTKLYQLRDVTTCKFSLKRRVSALVWLTWTPPCATFDICGHVLAESFHCFAHCERTMRCVHCKTTCVYITFRLTKTCICVTIYISHYIFHLPSHRNTWILIPPRDFCYLKILLNIPLWTYETMSEYIGSTVAKDW